MESNFLLAIWFDELLGFIFNNECLRWIFFLFILYIVFAGFRSATRNSGMMKKLVKTGTVAYNPEKPEEAIIDAFGTDKCRTFAEVIRVTNTSQYANSHPVQNVLFKVKPPDGNGWEVLLTLLAPSFAPYESGEIVEVAFDYANSRNTIGILSRSPDYVKNASSKFINIRQAGYHLLAVNRSGYYAGDAEFLFIKAQAESAGNVIELEIVVPEPKEMTLQANMNISNFCWQENYERKVRLQKQKRGIARVDSVEISNLFWGQSPIVRLSVTLETDGTAAFIDEPIHVLHLPEVGKHIFVAYDSSTKEATPLEIQV